MNLIILILSQLYSSLPLFCLILLGYCLVRFYHWPQLFTDYLTRFLFSIAIPVMLFRIMANFYAQEAVDFRLLIAYFGGSFIVFLIARFLIAKPLHLDGVSASIFGLGGIFSNMVLLGLPLASLFLGEESIPSVALVISFNALLLWSLVTISVEWSLNGSLSFQGVFITVKSVVRNPIVIGIFSGLFVSIVYHNPLPSIINNTAGMISQMTAPLSLIALGMGLAEYKISENIKISLWLSFVKLLIHPLLVWGIAILLGLPSLETKAVVLSASMSIGMNVYLMARQFKALQGPVASSLVIATALSILTTPIIISLIP